MADAADSHPDRDARAHLSLGSYLRGGSQRRDRSACSVSGGRNYHNADRRPDAATFCGARIRFGGVTDPRCVSVPNGRRNGRPRHARPTRTSGALGPGGRRWDDGRPDHLGDVFRLDPSENVHPIFHPVIVSSTAANMSTHLRHVTACYKPTMAGHARIQRPSANFTNGDLTIQVQSFNLGVPV
jgi:hypothetical protein